MGVISTGGTAWEGRPYPEGGSEQPAIEPDGKRVMHVG